MRVGLFYLPTLGSQRDIRAGGAGLRGDLYGRMLEEVVEQAQLADRLGYDFVSFTEHHLHVEGLEVSNNPVLLDLFVGLQTERIRVGQLGIVLPAENPVRVAENIAMLDHMTGGRALAGFTRGYQQRWVDVMTQHLPDVHAPVADVHDEHDARNRQLFEECFDIVKLAWTEDLLSYDGTYWKIPAPDTRWPIEATRKYGLGLGPDDRLESVAVVPKPLQKPHPEIYMPYAASTKTVEWCAAKGVTAVLAPLRPEIEADYLQRYASISGRPFGAGVGLRRDVIITDTEEEARRFFLDGPGFFWREWLSAFGHGRGLRDPVTGAFPNMIEDGYVLVGTAATVRRRLAELVERTKVELLVIGMYTGLVPREVSLRTLESFATDVVPQVTGGLVAPRSIT